VSGVPLAPQARIDLGAVLLLDAGANTPRVKSRLVGIVPGEFLVLQPLESRPGTMNSIVPGRAIRVRYLWGGRIFGFRCTSFGLSPAPRVLLFLSFPAEIEERNLRKHERVSCALPAALEHEGRTWSGRVLDLSVDGCLCALRTDSDEASLGVARIGVQVGLSLMVPGLEDGVSVRARVRNFAAEAGEARLGLSFESPSESASLAIAAFLDSVHE